MTERPAEGRAGKMRPRVECQVGRRPAGRVPGGARGIGTVGFRYAASRLLNRLRRERCDYSTGWVGALRLLDRLGGGAAAIRPAGGGRCGCSSGWVEGRAQCQPGWITVESRGPTAAMFHVKHREGFVTTPSPFDASTPLAREVADITRRRLALAAETFPLPDEARIFTVANQKGGVGKTTT